MFKNLRVETEPLIIRPLTSADAEDMHTIVSQENVVRFLPENVMSLDEVKGIISWLNDCYEKNSPDKIVKYTVGIEWKDDRRIIGWVGLGALDFDPAEIEIFCGLSEKYWGKGIATEAAMAMLYYGFKVIGLRKIVAVTDCQKVRSLKVIEKLKMPFIRKVVGLPEEYSHYEGNSYFSMTREEFIENYGNGIARGCGHSP